PRLADAWCRARPRRVREEVRREAVRIHASPRDPPHDRNRRSTDDAEAVEPKLERIDTGTGPSAQEEQRRSVHRPAHALRDAVAAADLDRVRAQVADQDPTIADTLSVEVVTSAVTRTRDSRRGGDPREPQARWIPRRRKPDRQQARAIALRVARLAVDRDVPRRALSSDERPRRRLGRKITDQDLRSVRTDLGPLDAEAGGEAGASRRAGQPNERRRTPGPGERAWPGPCMRAESHTDAGRAHRAPRRGGTRLLLAGGEFLVTGAGPVPVQQIPPAIRTLGVDPGGRLVSDAP